MKQRKYLPTFSDLIDRLTIALQKMVFLKEHQEDYKKEIALLKHDIDMILASRQKITADQLEAALIIQLTNRVIWENETHIRDGSSKEPVDVQIQRLRFTHSINGVRNTAKNVLSVLDGGRKDYKIDALSEDLAPELNNWRWLFER